MAASNNTFVDQVISLFTRDIYLSQPNFQSLMQALNKLDNQDLVLAYPIKLLNKRAKEDPVGWDTLLLAFKCPNDIIPDILNAQNITSSETLGDVLAKNERKRTNVSKMMDPSDMSSSDKKKTEKNSKSNDNQTIIDKKPEANNKPRRKSSAQMTEEILASLEILEQPLADMVSSKLTSDSSGDKFKKLEEEMVTLEVVQLVEQSVAMMFGENSAGDDNVKLDEVEKSKIEMIEISQDENAGNLSLDAEAELTDQKENTKSSFDVANQNETLAELSETPEVLEEKSAVVEELKRGNLDGEATVTDQTSAEDESSHYGNTDSIGHLQTETDNSVTKDAGDGLNIAPSIEASVNAADETGNKDRDDAYDIDVGGISGNSDGDDGSDFDENENLGIRKDSSSAADRNSEDKDIGKNGRAYGSDVDVDEHFGIGKGSSFVVDDNSEDKNDWYQMQQREDCSFNDNGYTEDGGLKFSSSLVDDRRRSNSLRYAGVPLLETIEENVDGGRNQTVQASSNSEMYAKEGEIVLDGDLKRDLDSNSNGQDSPMKTIAVGIVSMEKNETNNDARAVEKIINDGASDTADNINNINIYGMETDHAAYTYTSSPAALTHHRVSFGDSEAGESMTYRNFFSSTSSGINTNSNRSSVSSIPTNDTNTKTIDLSADPNTKSHPYHLFTRVVTDMENGRYTDYYDGLEAMVEDQVIDQLSPIDKELCGENMTSPLHSPMMMPKSDFSDFDRNGQHYERDDTLNMDIFDIIHKMRQKTVRVLSKQSKVNMQIKMTSRMTYDY